MKKNYSLIITFFGLFSVFPCLGQILPENNSLSKALLDSNIEKYLATENAQKLNFPNLTRNLYRQNNYSYIWFNRENKLLWDAMSLLDCVVQYGLNPNQYHSADLNYDTIRLVATSIAPNNSVLKGRADVLLTDAVLSFMVHLHFGRANPTISFQEIDSENFKGYQIDSVLKTAIQVPAKFSQMILGVQPKMKGYRQLQNFLRLAVHRHQEDCHEISGDTLKQVAINLERYKWENVNEEEVYVEINIPAFALKFVDKDSTQNFKVIIGNPSTPTPVLSGKIRYFKTAPDWTVPSSILGKELLPRAMNNPVYLKRNNFSIYTQKREVIAATPANLKAVRANPANYFIRQSPGPDNALGQIVFHFENPYSIYLHDTPNRKLFNQPNRALSHGCIRIEDPKMFVTRLLKHDSALSDTYLTVYNSMTSYKRFIYTLKKPVTIVIRYITCEIQNGALIKYPDLYKQDKKLIENLFNN